MKFIVSSAQLLKQLQSISGVLNSSNTLPILDNFLFDISSNTLTISASDLETTMNLNSLVKMAMNFQKHHLWNHHQRLICLH
jgi:DNA polymerase III sliding clamp (beta) subunit (PCNA family)